MACAVHHLYQTEDFVFLFSLRNSSASFLAMCRVGHKPFIREDGQGIKKRWRSAGLSIRLSGFFYFCYFFTAAVTNSTFLTIPEAGRAANVLGFVHSQMTCPLPPYQHLCFSSLWFPHWPVKELPQPRNPKCDYQDNSAHTRRFSII